jgi:hypothetical protein
LKERSPKFSHDTNKARQTQREGNKNSNKKYKNFDFYSCAEIISVLRANPKRKVGAPIKGSANKIGK